MRCDHFVGVDARMGYEAFRDVTLLRIVEFTVAANAETGRRRAQTLSRT